MKSVSVCWGCSEHYYISFFEQETKKYFFIPQITKYARDDIFDYIINHLSLKNYKMIYIAVPDKKLSGKYQPYYFSYNDWDDLTIKLEDKFFGKIQYIYSTNSHWENGTTLDKI